MPEVLHYRPNEKIDYPEDVARLRAELLKRGLLASDLDIHRAYREWSEVVYAAGWMNLNVAGVAAAVEGMIDGAILARRVQ